MARSKPVVNIFWQGTVLKDTVSSYNSFHLYPIFGICQTSWKIFKKRFKDYLTVEMFGMSSCWITNSIYANFWLLVIFPYWNSSVWFPALVQQIVAQIGSLNK